jgi:simple sugar transport system ATP-binding protein
MGAKEGAMILDLVARLKEEGKLSIIMILHNYVHVLEACDRVSMIQDGIIALDKPTADTSVEELTEIVVNEYRRAPRSRPTRRRRWREAPRRTEPADAGWL